MKTRARLQLDFRNYWHAGSGRGSGYHLDALCERDGDQLPTLPGRQLKGLLRHAVHRAEAWGWLKKQALPPGPVESHEELLFGSRSHSESRDTTQPGLLRVDSARLPDAERQWLAQTGETEPTELREELFGELFSTAINEQGSAQRYSLRGLEVCIPLTLHAVLNLAITAQQADHRAQQQAYLQAGTGWAVLDAALPLLDALGAHRSRGLGEARVSLILAGQGA
ncbi:RAMP superfamily CRISPR-associated protein [Azotobacter vinelandii]|uniref:RAMP superfamily CRISPR-associated protein n=1 Tax=Azotobacter vinelandii TaxID=354 RepID=UPI002665C604|nr:RAMP superfamily CRISPR-associated protein [Azotobacter vinelandii]WKN24022.1 RAMP superfamily CRISPR-associated protein [Azotobacter vinelandii]